MSASLPVIAVVVVVVVAAVSFFIEFPLAEVLEEEEGVEAASMSISLSAIVLEK